MYPPKKVLPSAKMTNSIDTLIHLQPDANEPLNIHTVAPPTTTITTTTEETPSKTQQPSTEPSWPELSVEHPLRKLQERLSATLSATGYNEIWGVRLSAHAPIPFSTTLVLQKFLRANANDVDKAAQQLQATLAWRKEFQPLKAAEEEVFDEDRFGGLGYITLIEDGQDGVGKRDAVVVTWNIYGAVKDPKKTFGDLDG